MSAIDSDPEGEDCDAPEASEECAIDHALEGQATEE